MKKGGTRIVKRSEGGSLKAIGKIRLTGREGNDSNENQPGSFHLPRTSFVTDKDRSHV